MLNGERLSQIPPGVVTWMWPPYLARGKLALLDGDPGVGKSLVTIDLAARLSRGGPLPGCAETVPPAVTVLLSAEDGAADTARPRAEAAGADLDRVIFASDVAGRLPRLPADLPALEECIVRHEAALVVIDPVMAFLPPNVAANADQCVRQALTPLAAVADWTGAAILLVRHLTKRTSRKAVYRGAGSIGILGAARCGLLAARHPTDPDLRVLSVTKSNLTGSAPSLGFRITADGQGRSVIEWTGPVDLDADGLCKTPPAELRPRDRAIDWLRRELAAGPRKAAEMYERAAAAAIPERTLKRAKADLHVESHKVRAEGGGGVWYWYDPAAAWPADAPFKRPKPFELPPLPGFDL